PQQLVVGGLRTDPAEEHADLGLPSVQVRAQDLDLLSVRNLDGGEPLPSPAHDQLSMARSTQVAYPLGMAARRDEIALVVVCQQVDRRRPGQPGRAAGDDEDPRSPHRDADAGEPGDHAVEHVLGERVGLDVAGLAHGTSTATYLTD